MSIAERTARHIEMSAEEYHAEREHDSNSSLKLAMRSPRLYHGVRIAGTMEDKPPSDAMRKGTVGHILMEDPDKFGDLVTVIPPEVLTKKGAKSGKAWKEWEAANAGKLHVKQAELDVIKWQCDSVWNNDDARSLLSGATIREHSIFWTTPQGDRLKCRLDAANELDAEIADLKFSAHAKGDKLARHASDLKWNCQAALYSDGFYELYRVRPTFTFIVVENAQPYECWTYALQPDFVAAGRELYREALATIRRCRETGNWYPEGYGTRREMFVPSYLLPALDDYPEA